MSDDNIIVSVTELTVTIQNVLTTAGVSDVAAKSTAMALADADACGQQGHGLRRLQAYVAQVRTGKICGNAIPTATQLKTGYVQIDAASGFAYPALELAVRKLIETAPAAGIACAAVNHSHHSGRMGYWAEQLAAAGLLALAFSNSPKAMAPWPVGAAVYGTNPIAFAAPRKNAPPLFVDLSLSKIARGKVMASKQRGESIAQGLAVDATGQPTTDATAALAGALLPMGEAKGSALALMVEILCAPLAGGNLAFDASSFFDDSGTPPYIGQLLIAIAPQQENFHAQMERLFCRIAEAAPNTRLPGENSRTTREFATRHGITLPRALWEEVLGLTK